MEQVRFLIDLSEKLNLGDELISKLYLLQGHIQSEFCLYADAIIALSSAIQKNPLLKEAYFERAVAYFELGEFDKAIEDYLSSDFQTAPAESKIWWKAIPKTCAGIAYGMARATTRSAIEFIPDSYRTIKGLGSGMWSCIMDPIGASKTFAHAAVECVQYIKNTSPSQAVQDMVPELRQLIQHYDHITEYEKGCLIGEIIGKYGTEILLCKYSAKAIKSYQNLKKADQLMTLEALASAENGHKVREASKKLIEKRSAWVSRLEIDMGHQRKHLPESPHFIEGKSVLTYDGNPKKLNELLRKKAGTGRKIIGEPGKAGAKEKVNFGEVIGYHVDDKNEG